MKKFSIILLLGFLLVGLAGCNKEENPGTPGNTNTPSAGTIETSGEAAPETSGDTGTSAGTSGTAALPTPTETITPTPTPSGNYVGFSLESGFYDKDQELTLYCNAEGAKIYYTLDGSIPSESSTLYEGPITLKNRTSEPNVLSAQTGIAPGNNYVPNFNVDKGTVIRAIAYLPDGSSTNVFHGTYFVGIDRAKYLDVPVISLVTEFDNLFDYETGIYTLGKTYDDFVSDPVNAALESWQMQGNYTNRGREWERPVSVELITADEAPGFKQDMGMRIMGASTRNQAQKSIRIYAREDYSKKNLKYELIPGNMKSDGTDILRKYKSFVLRIGGNDADFGRLRDPYLQNLVQNANFETQQHTPCVVFINGEYWGMYTITEDYSDNYFENNYGIDNKNIVLIKKGEVEDGEDSDIELYYDLFDFITGNDMSDAANYAKAGEMLDMDSFIDYCAFNLYIFNKDSIFDNNNWRMWRVRTADGATQWSDGKWRMALYDTDFSTGIYDGPDSANTDNISGVLESSVDEVYQQNMADRAPIEIFRSLMKNESFKHDFILALCDMRNIYLEPKVAKRALDAMSGTYTTLLSDSWKRFGPDWIAMNPEGHHAGKLKDLSSFISKRYVSILNIVKKIFDLESAAKLSLNANDKTMGTILVNGRPLDLSFDFGGMYYPGLTVTVIAIPADGYKFVGWNVKKGDIADATSDTLTITMKSAVTLQAQFEPK
ncbi:MAG: CotH kinase family protein [Lachnospiraceae bacterium]|nr:CotH kinase family protein [Lachnospiraceae bacterium]